MKMPEVIEKTLFAPCGMNCAVCYKHVLKHKGVKPCAGCLRGDEGKPGHCRSCKIKRCAQGKGYSHCYACGEFPCGLIRNLEKSYRKRYGASLIEHSEKVRNIGVEAFLANEREKWRCPKCGGALSLHDRACSECGDKRPFVSMDG